MQARGLIVGDGHDAGRRAGMRPGMRVLLVPVCLAAAVPAAGSDSLPRALVTVSGAGFDGDTAERAGAAFGLPLTVSGAASGAYPPPPEAPTERFAAAAAASVVGGPAGLPVLQARATGEVETLELRTSDAFAQALFGDSLVLDAGPVGDGFVTLGFSLSASVDVGPLGAMGHDATSLFVATLDLPQHSALLLLESGVGFGFGASGGSLRRLQGIIGPDGTPIDDLEERADAANAFAFDGYGFGVRVPFTSGVALPFQVAASCTVTVRQLFAPGGAGQPSRAQCEAGNSLALTGLLAVTDVMGRPLTEVSVRAASGFVYATPGGPGGVVPEPAAWALLIAGFGLVGGAARRRRSALAA